MNEPEKTVVLKDPEWLKDRELRSMRIMIEDLFQRYGHALDRIISLEKKVHLLQGSAKT